jgi:hypothetical protein
VGHDHVSLSLCIDSSTESAKHSVCDQVIQMLHWTVGTVGL